MKGWVYVITNSAMPNIVKVGYTTRDPNTRALELNYTGLPHPYKVVFEIQVDRPRTIEKRAHFLLGNCNAGKEWFRCTELEAIEANHKAIGITRTPENRNPQDSANKTEYPVYSRPFREPKNSSAHAETDGFGKVLFTSLLTIGYMIGLVHIINISGNKSDSPALMFLLLPVASIASIATAKLIGFK
jgi:hypothetical protein